MFSKSKKMKQKWFNVKLVLTVHDPHTQEYLGTYSFFCSINFIILLTHSYTTHYSGYLQHLNYEKYVSFYSHSQK